MLIIQIVKIILGSFYLLLLPGFVLSFIFFKNKLMIIERIAISITLSILVVPMTIFYLNKIKVPINLINSFFAILAIVIMGLSIIYLQKIRRNRVKNL